MLFRSTNVSFVEQFAKLMTSEFEMSMMGELKFFLGFEIEQYDEGTFICQTKYTYDMLKKFDMSNASPVRFPMAEGFCSVRKNPVQLQFISTRFYLLPSTVYWQA